MTLVYLALAWAAGIWLTHALWQWGALGCDTPPWPFAIAAGTALAALVLLRRRRQARWAAGLLLLAILGGWRYHSNPFAACATPSDLAFYNGDDRRTTWAAVEGIVTGYPDVRDVTTHYRLRAEKVTVDGVIHRVQGDLLVQAPRFPEYGYGDRLKVTGQMQTPPVLDDFDYRAYLAGRGIHSLLRRPRIERLARNEGQPFWAAIYALRARSAALLGRVLPEPAAALAAGMTLGIESGISEEVDEAFKITGTTHVIVISGSNIALLSGVLMAGLGRAFGKRRAAPLAIAAILLYVLFVGGDPAALRAGVMGSLYVLALALGRQSTAFVSLAASAMFLTLLNPLALWDLGFQLSFAATLGLILFNPTISAAAERIVRRHLGSEQARTALGFLNDSLIVTLSAQVTTLPLIITYFGRMSVVSLLTNLLILPVQPPILMGGLATVAVGLIWEPLARLVALVPWLFLTYTVAVVRLTAGLPLASLETGELGRALVPLFYGALAVGFAVPALRRVAPTFSFTPAYPTPDSPPANLAPAGPAFAPRAAAWAAAALVPLWIGLTAFNALPDGRLHLFFVPDEDGEAALLVAPGGQRVWLWDGRGDGAALARTGRELLTGFDRDVDLYVGPEPGAADQAGNPPLGARRSRDPGALATGTIVPLGDGVELTLLRAGPQTEAWLLRYGDLRVILPATLRPEAQTALLAAGADLRASVLKAAGPGTGAWPTLPFLQASAAPLILWPTDTTYPPDVGDALTARGAQRIPADATLELVSDGKRVWLQQWGGQRGR